MLAKVLGIEAQLPPKAIDAKKKKNFFFQLCKVFSGESFWVRSFSSFSKLIAHDETFWKKKVLATTYFI